MKLTKPKKFSVSFLEYSKALPRIETKTSGKKKEKSVSNQDSEYFNESYVRNRRFNQTCSDLIPMSSQRRYFLRDEMLETVQTRNQATKPMGTTLDEVKTIVNFKTKNSKAKPRKTFVTFDSSIPTSSQVKKSKEKSKRQILKFNTHVNKEKRFKSSSGQGRKMKRVRSLGNVKEFTLTNMKDTSEIKADKKAKKLLKKIGKIIGGEYENLDNCNENFSIKNLTRVIQLCKIRKEVNFGKKVSGRDINEFEVAQLKLARLGPPSFFKQQFRVSTLERYKELKGLFIGNKNE